MLQYNSIALQSGKKHDNPLKPFANKEESATHQDYHPIFNRDDLWVGMNSYYVDNNGDRYKLVQIENKPSSTGERNVTNLQTSAQLIEIMKAMLKDKKNNLKT
jgi:hypothetical protein